MSKPPKSGLEISRDSANTAIEKYAAAIVWVSPGIRERFIVRVILQLDGAQRTSDRIRPNPGVQSEHSDFVFREVEP